MKRAPEDRCEEWKAGWTRTSARLGARILAPLLHLVLLFAAGGCALSVNDHLAEARSNSPGAVKDAVVAIGEILYRKEGSGLPFDEADREAILFIKEVAASDPVPVNRTVAISTLGKIRKADAVEVFRKALKDPFWPARLSAVESMGNDPREECAADLRELHRSETSPVVRIAIARALRKIGGPVAVQTLLEMYLQPREAARDTRIHAYDGLRELTGLNYGIDEKVSWERYYLEKFPPPRAEGPAAGTEARAAGGTRAEGNR